MTQHIVHANSELCKYEGKPVNVIFGFDRPLNEMFINIILETEVDGDIEEDTLSYQTQDTDDWISAIDEAESQDFWIHPTLREILKEVIAKEFIGYQLGAYVDTQYQKVYTLADLS